MNPLLRYQLKYTEETRTPLVVPRSSIVSDAGDIAFIGKNRLEYGEVFNTNVLRLLENFAAPENPDSPGTPDIEAAIAPLFTNPMLGQIWFNKTQKKPYVWTGTMWAGVNRSDQVAGNSGVIAHGQQLPKPEDSQGIPFEYSECSWVVSPFGTVGAQRLAYVACYTDADAKVTMEYMRSGVTSLETGFANYQIIGIRGSSDNGTPGDPLPPPDTTPSASPTRTPTRTPTPTPSYTPAPTRTPGHTVTASVTPTVTRTSTPPSSATPTITASTTPTPTVTPTPTPSNMPVWMLVEGGTTEVDVPSSESTGKPCMPTPPPEECHIGTLGDEIDMVSECYIDSNTIRRTTKKYRCNLQADCSVP